MGLGWTPEVGYWLAKLTQRMVFAAFDQSQLMERVVAAEFTKTDVTILYEKNM